LRRRRKENDLEREGAFSQLYESKASDPVQQETTLSALLA